jgi:hypothetical protein
MRHIYLFVGVRYSLRGMISASLSSSSIRVDKGNTDANFEASGTMNDVISNAPAAS